MMAENIQNNENEPAQEDNEDHQLIEETVGGNAVPQKAMFTRKPLTFLQELLALRQKGQDFSHSPMGFICQGQRLPENHPFFHRLDHGGGEIVQPIRAVGATETSTEEEDDDAEMEIFDNHAYGKEFANKHDDFDDTQLKDVVINEEGDSGAPKIVS